MHEFILIDGSYYMFYRYFAITAWWKAAKKDEEIGVPIENEEFVEKYRKTFVDKLREMPKKLKLNNPDKAIIMVARDCPREDIWRTKLFPEYKGNRDYSGTGFEGGPLFKLAYEEKLFEEGGADVVMRHPHLEADDCLAITAKHIRDTHGDKDISITIITSDTDYLQICQEPIRLINLKYKPVNTEKNSYGHPEKDLFCKIVTGDTSDNIPGVFKKCGKKTAEKYWNDRNLFKKKLAQDETGETQRRYERNSMLIDFERIPEEYVEEFRRDTLKIK